MIGRINGQLLEKNPPQITVDVQGLGYEIDVPMSTFYNLPACGEKVSLYMHQIVREDGHYLYGFGSEAERAAFRQLLKISGIGARTALAVLSGMSVGELAHAVTMQEVGRLIKVPGIGKKTAERLRARLPKFSGGGTPSVGAGETPLSSSSDILNALLALGYSEREALAAMKTLPVDASVSDGIRAALKVLSKS